MSLDLTVISFSAYSHRYMTHGLPLGRLLRVFHQRLCSSRFHFHVMSQQEANPSSLVVTVFALSHGRSIPLMLAHQLFLVEQGPSPQTLILATT